MPAVKSTISALQQKAAKAAETAAWELTVQKNQAAICQLLAAELSSNATVNSHFTKPPAGARQHYQ